MDLSRRYWGGPAWQKTAAALEISYFTFFYSCMAFVLLSEATGIGHEFVVSAYRWLQQPIF
jgi:hypothetical protein